MAIKTNAAAFLFFNIACFWRLSASFLDIDELNSKYGIDIVDTPVVMGQSLPGNVITLSSKFGQPYQCSYHDKEVDMRKEREEEKVALDTGIPELLRPMDEGPCLLYNKDWWSYEFCYGKYIRQYHMEDGKITSAIIFLGHYESEYDWNSTSGEQARWQKVNRFHTQQYVNGTKCDLTDSPRRAEVRFQCREGQGDYISRIDEPETCAYIVTVHTTRICHHPYLKAPSPSTPVPITCNPVLTQDQYNDYLHYQEEMNSKLQDLEQKKTPMKVVEEESESDDASVEDEVDRDSETDDIKNFQAIFMESLKKNLENLLQAEHDAKVANQGSSEEDQSAADTETSQSEKPLKDVKVKVISDTKDLRQYLESLKQMKKAEKAEKTASSDPADPSTRADESDEDEKAGETTDDSIGSNEERQQPIGSDEDERARQGTGSTNQVKDPSTGDTGSTDSEDPDVSKTQDVTQTEKPNISPDKTHDPGTTDDTTDLVKQFDKEINEITEGDIDREKRLAEYKDTVESAMHAQFNDIVEEAQAELEGEGVDPDMDRGETFKALANTLSTLLKRLDKAEKEIKSTNTYLKEAERKSQKAQDEINNEEDLDGEDEEEDDYTVSEPDKPTDNTPQTAPKQKQGDYSTVTLDNRVRVRLSKIKAVDGVKGEGEEAIKKSLKLPAAQKEKLESSVKQELEKAGLDTGGRKIEVRIVTAGYYDDKDGSPEVHVFSEDESSAFNKMISDLLAGNQEADREAARYDKMTTNYGFVWDKRKKKETD